MFVSVATSNFLALFVKERSFFQEENDLLQAGMGAKKFQKCNSSVFGIRPRQLEHILSDLPVFGPSEVLL